MRLEIGSGYAPTPGFVHLDVNPNAPDVDIVSVAFPLGTIGSETVEEMRCVDVLEHISYRDTDTALAEWARVLVPGGRIYIQVPDAEQIMAAYFKMRDGMGRVLDTPPELAWSPLNAVQWRLLGGHADGERVHEQDDWRWNAHYSLWSERELTQALDQAGIEVISCVTNAHPNLCVDGAKR